MTGRRLAWAAVALWTLLALRRSLDERLVFSDSAVYAVLGEALAEGQGYRRVDQAGDPAFSYYPFLYPLLTAGLRLTGTPPAALTLLNVLAGAVLLWMVLRFLSDRFPPGLAVPLAMLAALGAHLEHALMMMSDLTAAAFGIGGILAAERYGREGPALSRRGILAAALLLAAAWTREAALSAGVAACSWLLLDAPDRRGARRKAAFLLLAVGLGWGLWTLRAALAGGGVAENLEATFLRTDTGEPLGGAAGLLQRLRNACLRDHPVILTRLMVFNLPLIPPPWLCFSFCALAAVGLAWRCLAARGIAEHLVVATGAMLALVQILNERYLIPVAPLLLAYAAWGVLRLAGKAAERVRPLLVLAATAAAAAGLFWHAAHPYANRGYVAELASAGRWLAGHAGAGDLVLCDDTACLHAYSGLKGFPAARGREAAERAIASGEVRWIVVEGNADAQPRIREAVLPAVSRFRGRLEARWRSGGTVVYAVPSATAR